MPFVGRLGAAGLAKEVTENTFVAPTEFIRFLPPFNFNTEIALLESKGIAGIPDVVYKVQQGAGLLKAGKIKFECEPENVGNHLMACFGVDTVTGNGTTTPYTHAFTKLGNASLKSYSWWQKNGVNYPEHSGCMLNKLEFVIKAKEFVMVDADWIGRSYVSGGVTQALSYSVRQPLKFDQAVLTIGGSAVTLYDNIKISFDNMIEAVHTLSSTIYAGKIFSKGFKVSLSADLVFEDTTEWTKFINGTSTSATVAITSTETIAGISPTAYYSLTFSIPTVYYNAAPIPMPDGLIKVPFVGTAVYTTASTKTASASLVNSVSTAY